ncbi:MAG TPA: DUF1569 domain-containing protein [Pirellulales bacterium]|nr:DUF1569 domain-containing protein [Pirellulales bacterium]
MAVNTRDVMDRREVHYESFHDLLADAEALAQGEVLTLGNWTLGQIFLHLARSIHASIDGTAAHVAWWTRLVVRLFYARRLLAGPMPAGLQLPEEVAGTLTPKPTSVEKGIASLRAAIERLHFETERAAHPLLGELSLDQWDRFHLRHAELHMSFAVPVEEPALV